MDITWEIIPMELDGEEAYVVTNSEDSFFRIFDSQEEAEEIVKACKEIDRKHLQEAV